MLTRGTPQRCRIIPVRDFKSFMSWEDTLVRALPAPFPLCRYLHQPSLAVSLPSCFLTPLVFSPMFMSSFIIEPIDSAGDLINTSVLCVVFTQQKQHKHRGVDPSHGVGVKLQDWHLLQVQVYMCVWQTYREPLNIVLKVRVSILTSTATAWEETRSSAFSAIVANLMWWELQEKFFKCTGLKLMLMLLYSSRRWTAAALWPARLILDLIVSQPVTF